MSEYSERILARRAQGWGPFAPLPPRGADVIAEIACPGGSKYYLRSCERDCGATVCQWCGQPARAAALFNEDLVKRFNWSTPIKDMGLAELIAFTEAFNVIRCREKCATTSPKVAETAV